MVRYLHPADHHPARIEKVDKDFARELGFEDRKFPIKIKDIHKIEKKNCISISVFRYKNKQKYPIYVSRNTFKRHAYLLLIGEKVKKSYVSTKDFSTYMHDYILHCGRKHFCRYCLRSFNTKEILQFCINDCFKINGKQEIKMPKNDEYVRLKKY